MNRRSFFSFTSKAIAGVISFLVIGKPEPKPEIIGVDVAIDGGSQGGYLVPPEYQKQIIDAAQRQSVIRSQGSVNKFGRSSDQLDMIDIVMERERLTDITQQQKHCKLPKAEALRL